MNSSQRIVLTVTAPVLGLMVPSPPFHVMRGGTDQCPGYSFILSPPQVGLLRATLDALALIGQCLVGVMIGGIVFFALKD
jgi:hypothetical protein